MDKNCRQLFGSWLALVAGVAVVILGVYLDLREPALHRWRAEGWSAQHGLRLVGTMQKHYWNNGPFWYCGANQTIYSVAVEDGDHRSDVLWVRTGAVWDDFELAR